MSEACRNCKGRGWVCENHLDRPWDYTTGEGCDCGAGSPCPVCNLQMAAASLTEPLRELVVRCISWLADAERKTSWGNPTFGPSPSEEMQEALDAILALKVQP